MDKSLGIGERAGGDGTYASGLLRKETTGSNFSEIFKGVVTFILWRGQYGGNPHAGREKDKAEVFC